MNSIYPVLSGALAQEKRLELITNNLANVGTNGFKKDVAVFEGLTPHLPEAAGTTFSPFGSPFGPLMGADATFGYLKEVSTDFSAGPMRITGEPLDIAIQGEGFFAVQSPEGVRYTRNGRFTLDKDGQLVTSAGFPVLGSGGPINLPPGVVSVDSNGNISVRGIEANATAVEIDQLPVYTLNNGSGTSTLNNGSGIGTLSNQALLRKAGGSLFEIIAGTAIPSIEGRVQQGAIEESNVNAVEEMVAMIEVMRLYEAAQKAMQTADEIAAKSANEIGVVG